MRKGTYLFAALATGLILVATTPASAALSETFFSGGDASAAWVEFTPAPPGASENASIALKVNAMNGTDYDDFAGVDFAGIASDPPADAPSFDFRSSVTRVGSGGSPRLVMRFSDGGRMELRPLGWTADTWVTVDGAVTDANQGWDVYGGTCGFLYQATYAAGLACHSTASVTRMFVVDDSGWFSPGGYTHLIDNVTYDGETVSYPTRCVEDFTGSHETGPVSSPVHGSVEPLDPGLGIHGTNCDLIVETLGL